MERPRAPRRRGLSREAVVALALKIGEREGLEAVSLRRLASELGVTPMALYRHVRDKQDLINAMTEVVLADLDLTVGFTPSMPWAERARLALNNLKQQLEARPLALPLSMAYSGEGPFGFWRMTEDLLGLLLSAGFERRQAVVLMRVIANLISGYLLLMRADRAALPEHPDPRGLDLLRRRLELTQLSLPPDRFPHTVGSAREIAEVRVSDPDCWWRATVELVVLGLEQMRERVSVGAEADASGQRSGVARVGAREPGRP